MCEKRQSSRFVDKTKKKKNKLEQVTQKLRKTCKSNYVPSLIYKLSNGTILQLILQL